jgi:hypothetical protein
MCMRAAAAAAAMLAAAQQTLNPARGCVMLFGGALSAAAASFIGIAVSFTPATIAATAITTTAATTVTTAAAAAAVVPAVPANATLDAASDRSERCRLSLLCTREG